MKNVIIVFGFLSMLLLFSCNDSTSIEYEGYNYGLKPVYAQGDDWQDVRVSNSEIIRQLGKIYYKEPYIYVNEVNKGIHIIDNTIPTQPQSVKFIHIPGSKDIAIKGDFLYSDNVTDLVVLDISDFNTIQVVNRISNIYPPVEQNFPEFHTGYFECVDPSKGTVIGWESALLDNPKCRR